MNTRRRDVTIYKIDTDEITNILNLVLEGNGEDKSNLRNLELLDWLQYIA